ncbi:MAG: hypothetical protein K2Q24_00720 [Chitinophagaceae bacterium]|nr:hypothetical protein [Chitinophagaceae bacterium]
MQQTEIQMIVFLIFIVLFVLMLFALIVLIFFAYRKKQALHFEKENILKAEHEKQLIASRMEIHESTLTEISREIHDNINLSLTLAKLQLNTISWNDVDASKLVVCSCADLISKTIDELSNLSRSLNADIITSQGLINALEAEVERINRSAKINIMMHIFGKTKFLESQKELILFRIIQEALQNIIKHAAAGVVRFDLYFQEEELQICIADDGIGYSAPHSKQNGAGITNMQARVAALKGNFKLKGIQNKGTTITITIPYTGI